MKRDKDALKDTRRLVWQLPLQGFAELFPISNSLPVGDYRLASKAKG